MRGKMEIDARDKSVSQVVKELAHELQRMADRALNDIVDNLVIPKMKDYINEEWYRDGVGGTAFYNSLGEMSKIYGKLEINVKEKYIVVGYATDQLPLNSAPLTTFFNQPRGIQRFADKENYWPNYVSIVDGEDMREDMPYVIEYGWNIGNLVDGYLDSRASDGIRRRREGIYADSYLRDFLKNNFVKLMKQKMLSKQG